MDGDSLTLIVAIAALMAGLWRLIAQDMILREDLEVGSDMLRRAVEPDPGR